MDELNLIGVFEYEIDINEAIKVVERMPTVIEAEPDEVDIPIEYYKAGCEW